MIILHCKYKDQDTHCTLSSVCGNLVGCQFGGSPPNIYFSDFASFDLHDRNWVRSKDNKEEKTREVSDIGCIT